MYAAVVIHPDIAQAVGVVSKFRLQLTKAHLTAVKRILKVTQNLAIKLQESDEAWLLVQMHTGLMT